MENIYLLSVAYDKWIRDKTIRSTWRVRTANKLIEEVLKHTPYVNVIRMHNNDARYDSIRSYLDDLAGVMGPNDIFWLQYDGEGSNLISHEPIDSIESWDGKGELPFIEDFYQSQKLIQI